MRICQSQNPPRDIAVLFTTLVIILQILANAGCVSSSSARFEASKRPAKAKDFPMEILDEMNITRPHKVIGLVRVNAGARFNISDPIEVLKQQGRRLGADALVSLTVNGVGVGMISGGVGIYSGHVRDSWQAKAIVWTD